MNDFIELGREVSSEDIIGSLAAQGIDASAFGEEIDALLDDDILTQAPARLIERLTSAIAEGLGSESLVDREGLAEGISAALVGSAQSVDLLGFIRELRAKGATAGDMSHVFDTRQGARLATMLAGDFDAAVATLLEKAPGAAQAMAEARMKGIVGSVNRWNSALTNAFIAIAESGVMDEVSGALDRMAAATTRLGESNPAMLKFGTYALGALAVVGPLGFALGGVASAFSLLGSVISVPLVALKGIGMWAGAAATSAVGLQGALARMDGRSYGNVAKAGTALAGIARAIPGVSLLAGMASGVAAFAAAITAPAWGAIALGVAAVAGAGLMVWRYWDRLSAIFGGVARALGEQLSPAIDAIRPYLRWLEPFGATVAAGWEKARAAMQAFGDWISSFFSQETLSEEQKAAWGTYGYELGTQLAENVKTAIGALITWFTTVPSMILNAIGSIDLSGIIKMPSISSFWGGQELPSETATAIDGARAKGGPVSAGGTYLVGEEGPELFSPEKSGRIIPNDETMEMLRGSGSAASEVDAATRPLQDTSVERATVESPRAAAAPDAFEASPSQEGKGLPEAAIIEQPLRNAPLPEASGKSSERAPAAPDTHEASPSHEDAGSPSPYRAPAPSQRSAPTAPNIGRIEINVHGVNDPLATARAVRRELEDRLRFDLRGAFSDS